MSEKQTETDQQTATRLGVSLEDYHKTIKPVNDAKKPSVDAAVIQLNKSPRGWNALCALREFLESDTVLGLDSENQQAILTLVSFRFTGTDILRERDELMALLLAIREDIHMQGFLKDSTRENLNAVTNKP